MPDRRVPKWTLQRAALIVTTALATATFLGGLLSFLGVSFQRPQEEIAAMNVRVVRLETSDSLQNTSLRAINTSLRDITWMLCSQARHDNSQAILPPACDFYVQKR